MKTERYEVINLIAESEEEMATLIKCDDGGYNVTHIMGVELSTPYFIEELPTPKENSTGWYRYKAIQVTDYDFNRKVKAIIHVAICYCHWQWNHLPKNKHDNKLLEDIRLDGFHFTLYQNDEVRVERKIPAKHGKIVTNKYSIETLN